MIGLSDDTETGICEKCIGNPDFAGWIAQNGRKGECDFDSAHGNSNSVVTVEEFTGRMKQLIAPKPKGEIDGTGNDARPHPR
ncbi:MAG TPA: hypothetical protein VN952_04295 [Chthoniobacterales bacterium]|nr:hypothetical protein [Chthoniobacterales bacterium]